MRTRQSITAAMVDQESGNPVPQTENNENGNFREMPLPLAGSHSFGGGIALNRVAADLQPQIGPIYDPMATEKEEEEKSKKEQAPVPAVAENNVSGVRKKLLIPAEEALDSARVTAELIMKDAMDALQRTKQRLMDILLPHSSTSQAPPPAANKGSKTNSDAVSADEADNQGSENIPSTEVVNIFSEPAMGIVFPLHRQSAAAVAVNVQSRL